MHATACIKPCGHHVGVDHRDRPHSGLALCKILDVDFGEHPKDEVRRMHLLRGWVTKALAERQASGGGTMVPL
jgi:hypothetical protein